MICNRPEAEFYDDSVGPCPECGHAPEVHFGVEHCSVCELVELTKQLRATVQPEGVPLEQEERQAQEALTKHEAFTTALFGEPGQGSVDDERARIEVDFAKTRAHIIRRRIPIRMRERAEWLDSSYEGNPTSAILREGAHEIDRLRDFVKEFLDGSISVASLPADDEEAETTTWCVHCGADARIPDLASTISHASDCLVIKAEELTK